uniref:Myosin motor domain-containing protein n=1 Tax=Parascaris equorum TaxID=6256 RepID=A0A914R2A3_PAREQ
MFFVLYSEVGTLRRVKTDGPLILTVNPMRSAQLIEIAENEFALCTRQLPSEALFIERTHLKGSQFIYRIF